MNNLLVIKVGGNVIDDEKRLKAFLRDFAALETKKILVHGGGKLANKLAEDLNVPQQVVEGRRVTNAETLKIVTMVYAGYINKNIVAALQASNCNAIGLCGADADAILAHKRVHTVMDYGFVGDIDMINVSFLNQLLSMYITPVFAPITHDQRGQLLNTNADTIAQEIAAGLSQDHRVTLIYLFDKTGVLTKQDDEKSLIPLLNRSGYIKLKDAGTISQGMVPKLDNAFAALQKGIEKVLIGSAEQVNELVQGNAGTTIVND